MATVSNLSDLTTINYKDGCSPCKPPNKIGVWKTDLLDWSVIWCTWIIGCTAREMKRNTITYQRLKKEGKYKLIEKEKKRWRIFVLITIIHLTNGRCLLLLARRRIFEKMYLIQIRVRAEISLFRDRESKSRKWDLSLFLFSLSIRLCSYSIDLFNRRYKRFITCP